jgi:hypothetical protein
MGRFTSLFIVCYLFIASCSVSNTRLTLVSTTTDDSNLNPSFALTNSEISGRLVGQLLPMITYQTENQFFLDDPERWSGVTGISTLSRRS